MMDSEKQSQMLGVLIETYWNVKVGKPLPFKNHFESINRNILECKGCRPSKYGCPNVRINRNILECKALSLDCFRLDSPRINRNILECKDASELAFLASVA